MTFRKDFARATRALRSLIDGRDSVGDTARSFLCLADDYTFQPREYQESHDLLAAVRAQEPDFLPALLCLTYFEVAFRRTDGLQLCEEARRAAPDHWQPYHMRGRRLRAERPDDAIADLREAVRLTRGECEPTLSYLVQTLLVRDQTAKAREQLDLAREAFPDATGLAGLEAVLCEREGRPDTADAALQALVDLAGPQRAQMELGWLPPELQATATEIIRRRQPR